jgi:hypothetical protein
VVHRLVEIYVFSLIVDASGMSLDEISVKVCDKVKYEKMTRINPFTKEIMMVIEYGIAGNKNRSIRK